MLKLIHGADFHLDSPFSGLTPDRAAQRRGEQRLLLEALARLAKDRQADLVLLSGDLFDSEQVYRETLRAMMTALQEIPCPVFIAPGNHDFYGESSPYARLSWPDNVHIFTSDKITGFALKELNCTVWGRAFLGPHDSASPLAGFAAPADGQTHLMALHGAVGPASDYGPISPEEIAASGLAYLALGHVHKYSGLQKAGGTFWAYPGCPEGRGFDETGLKGVICAQVDGGEVREEFVPLCRRRYEIVTADITGRPPLDAIHAAVEGSAVDDIYRIILTGEGMAPNLEELTKVLAPSFYGLTLRDETRLPRDLWDRKEEDSLTGLFLRQLWEACRQDPDNAALQQAVRFGLAALEHGEDPYL